MALRCFKSILVAAFSLSSLFFFNVSMAQDAPVAAGETAAKEPAKLDPAKIILEHVADAHEFHFFTFNKKPVSIPLPVIVYSPAKGLSVFMSSRFEHGNELYDGYRLLNEEYLEENKLDAKVFKPGKIYAADADGRPDASVKVLDISLGRNAVQMIISVLLLILIMRNIAGKYAKGQGVRTAPTGFQGVVEPVIIFVRDEVGKANLGSRYEKYMPFLLTVFFFILINNLIGLIPGTANVTGNIAFTAVLGLLAFLVIMFSTRQTLLGAYRQSAGAFWRQVHHVAGGADGHLYQAFCVDHSSFCQHDLGTYHHSQLHHSDLYLWRNEYRSWLGNFAAVRAAVAVYLPDRSISRIYTGLYLCQPHCRIHRPGFRR